MTSIAAYKIYECTKCGQGHIEAIYGTINFKYPPPPNKKPSDLVVCQKCAVQLPLSEFNFLGVKDKPRRNYSTCESIVRKIKGIKPESSPLNLYPPLSGKPFDPESEIQAFKRLGMSPEQFPAWFKNCR